MSKKQKRLATVRNDFQIAQSQLEMTESYIRDFDNGELYHPLGRKHLEDVRDYWDAQYETARAKLSELEGWSNNDESKA